MDFKNFIFKHIEKFILGIAVSYLIYTAVNTFVMLDLKIHNIDTKLFSVSNTVERKLKTSTPPSTNTELENVAQLELRLTSPPDANPLQRPQLFTKFTQGEVISDITYRDLLKKQNIKNLPHLEVTTPGDTEFIFEGGTANLALLQVRKLYKDKWWVDSFAVEKGKSIGEKKKVGKETVDFNTHCQLIEIVPLAQKPLVIKKTAVLRNEGGEFLGASFTEETHMITTSKIVFKHKNGESYNLWIGESVNLGTETVSFHPVPNTSPTN